ncbi:IQ domain-containing protein IQM2-like [Abrus precatorius]|uniref:IQ domain-containing protein IQM2-like n=1 Tax=Abrus precatorius TaxID=3816 RepID=A0A8B8K3H0_ABRPR|nr:IQ domain-containing protein IQM2-like [Abrus precatorius]
MGISFSCSFVKCNCVEDGLDSMIVKSLNSGNDEIKIPLCSVSFKNGDLEPTIVRSLGFGKMSMDAPVNLDRKDLENIISTRTLAFNKEKSMTMSRINEKSKEMDDQSSRSKCQMEKIQSAPLDPDNPKHMAALKLQKVYKSFRTRRKLADCAILIEQNWWKLLDFAELKRSSISFFDIEKHETAISRWSRARTRAAKVGKGLSKDAKARKLALQHWLEAIDPRHRYGHNLHFYYEKWLKCQSREPFFYWLDIGEGKEVNLEKCPRSKLQQQCIEYLGPMERLPYEVVVEVGKFFYKQSGKVLHTTGEGARAKWIFVLSTSKILYVGKKKKGSFQHSSFLAGGATSCAGRLVVEHGVLKAVWPHSGHYRPTEDNFKEFISFLRERDVDLSDVKMTSVDEDDQLCSLRRSGHLRSHSSEEDFTENMCAMEAEEKANLMETESSSALVAPKSRRFQNFGRELTNLEIPKRGQMFEGLQNGKTGARHSNKSFQMDSHAGYQETAQAFAPEMDQTVISHVGTIPKESILKRIASRNKLKSYQLGKQLSCRWTTGAGPRIGCVRDYPCELQFRALEQVSLSPRSDCYSTSSFARTISATVTNISFQSLPRGVEHNTRLVRGRSVIPIIHIS